MSALSLNSSVISLSKAFGPLVVRGDGIEVEFRDGKILVRSGSVKLEGSAQFQNSASPAALKVGDVVTDGPNKGWIYCETKKGEAFLVAPKDSGVMEWSKVMIYLACRSWELPIWELPSKEQLNAMYEARNTGALKRTFNVRAYGDAGRYWSNTSQLSNGVRWCQRFNDGHQSILHTYTHNSASVRCVRRYSIT